MHTTLQRISEALHAPATDIQRLGGGCIATVVSGTTPERGAFVAKLGDGSTDLTIESRMLEDLGRVSALPIPRVWHAEQDLLIMERLPGSPGADEQAQQHLAELVAHLHGQQGPSFGYERDTLIGSLHQPNPSEDHWAAFFAEHRVLHFAQVAHAAGGLADRGLDAATRLAWAIQSTPDRFVARGEAPVLIHGDLWSGNFLSHAGRITGLIDPAIYYADREIELAFMGLFGCVGRAFFERYHELRPIQPGFFEHRLGLYRVYPLLVHAALFGGGYGRQSTEAMERALGHAGADGKGD